MKNSSAKPLCRSLAENIVLVASDADRARIINIDMAVKQAVEQLRRLSAENSRENLHMLAAQIKDRLSTLDQGSLTVHLLCYAYAKISGRIHEEITMPVRMLRPSKSKPASKR
jgi:hypothetical protein